MTLTEFLLERIAEDEAAAREARGRRESGTWVDRPDWTGTTERHSLVTAEWRTVFTCCDEGRDLGAEINAANAALATMGFDPAPLVPEGDRLHEDGREGIGVADPAEVAHIARHDPTRVLAECEAKRGIVELHRGHDHWYLTKVDDGPVVHTDYTFCAVCSPGAHDPSTAVWPCATLRVLGAVYADHKGYREEWKP